ncbi:membrane progestin receptor beta-like [Aulostomus maculatus]
MPEVSFTPPSLRLPSLPVLDWLLPSLPPTVRDMDVPPLFRQRFILSGYRPVGLSWRRYVLSLFQIHNETVNVWSHLLAAACVVARFLLFTVLQGGGILGVQLQGPEGQGLSLDVSSLPLVFHVISAVTYLSCSAAAHLLQSHSDQAHYSLAFLDYVGVAIHQYGCALALYVYSADTAWTQSMLGQIFLPASIFFAWLSCATCCYAKLQFLRPYPPHRKRYHLVPVGVAYLLIISPVTNRLSTRSWTSDSALQLHFLQVVLLLLAALFLSFPIPEHFSPGRYDIIGHSHQLFHVLLSTYMLVQQEALFKDFLRRRPSLIRMFGEERLLLASASFLSLVFCCLMTAFTMSQRAKAPRNTGQIP